MRQAEHHVRLPGWAWSLILAAAAIVQAVSYPGWTATGIGIGAGLVVAGIAAWIVTGSRWSPWPAFAGHIILLALTVTFAVAVASDLDETPMAWELLSLLLVAAVLHSERILCIGTNIGRR